MVLSLDNYGDIDYDEEFFNNLIDYEELFNNLSEEELFSIMQLCQTALHGILGWE